MQIARLAECMGSPESLDRKPKPASNQSEQLPCRRAAPQALPHLYCISKSPSPQKRQQSHYSVSTMWMRPTPYRACPPNSNQKTCRNNLPQLKQKTQALDGPAPFWALPGKTRTECAARTKNICFFAFAVDRPTRFSTTSAQHEKLYPKASAGLKANRPTRCMHGLA